jgi:hypothetical protein
MTVESKSFPVKRFNFKKNAVVGYRMHVVRAMCSKSDRVFEVSVENIYWKHKFRPSRKYGIPLIRNSTNRTLIDHLWNSPLCHCKLRNTFTNVCNHTISKTHVQICHCLHLNILHDATECTVLLCEKTRHRRQPADLT